MTYTLSYSTSSEHIAEGDGCKSVNKSTGFVVRPSKKSMSISERVVLFTNVGMCDSVIHVEVDRGCSLFLLSFL